MTAGLGPEMMPAMMAFPLEIVREGVGVPAAIGLAFGAESEAATAEDRRLLPPGEFARLTAFKYPRRRSSFLLGRLAAKAAIAECFPMVPAGSIEIANGVLGQPWIKTAAGVDAEISLAHCEGAAAAVACAAGHPIGVDLEWIDPERAVVARDSLTAAELALAGGLGLREEAAAFVGWSLREALGKVLRCGLAAPLDVLAAETIAADDEVGGYVARFRNFPQYHGTAWLLDGYVLAIVLPRPGLIRFPALAAARQRCAGAKGTGL
jgi:phosphopantetheinyl transferase